MSILETVSFLFFVCTIIFLIWFNATWEKEIEQAQAAKRERGETLIKTYNLPPAQKSDSDDN